MSMTPAFAAVRAAKNAPRWGVFAALRYAVKNGATLGQFDAAVRFEERRRIRAAFGGYMA